MIAAVDEELGIGKNNSIPWNYPKDLSFFRFMTMNHKIIMGRNTFESLPVMLKGREMLILSERRRGEIVEDGGVKAKFVDWDTLMLVEVGHFETVFVCGGESVYKQMLNITDEIILTRIPGTYDCDTFFPEFDSKFDKIVEMDLGDDLSIERWVNPNR